MVIPTDVWKAPLIMSLETWKSDVQVLPPVRLPAPLDEGEGVLGGVSLLRNQDRDKLTLAFLGALLRPPFLPSIGLSG